MNEIQMVVYEADPPPRPPMCLHRWAWLIDGRQACGYCGKPR